jgi:hypothetical protein
MTQYHIEANSVTFTGFFMTISINLAHVFHKNIYQFYLPTIHTVVSVSIQLNLEFAGSETKATNNF